ncbi:outer membrane beta-barrel protein [Lutibacter flavus]|uniref:Outer membrane protein beta-barrel domain-containing protein n=1 Tax=Lutibacter flavus TaxID=691689 RepID=A0A238ZHT2_9FLAO|nr:outer membrane beta-barrel protein [Lutibacter flavus]SNR82244.1 Outer membrane protein beta-barrel domain-containing protein [Lutibacter flavus]
MKKITLLFFLFLGITTFGQQIYIETGKTASSFEFKDSQGTSLENMQATTNNHLAVGFKSQVFTKNLNLSLGLTYNSYGSIASNQGLDNYYEWNTDYLGVNLGFDYNLFNVNKFTFYLKAATSVEFIVQGNQIINNQIFNIVGVQEFNSAAIFLKGGAGISYPVSEKSTLYLSYIYGKSLALKDNLNSNESELKIKSNMVGLGISVKL